MADWNGDHCPVCRVLHHEVRTSLKGTDAQDPHDEVPQRGPSQGDESALDNPQLARRFARCFGSLAYSARLRGSISRAKPSGYDCGSGGILALPS